MKMKKNNTQPKIEPKDLTVVDILNNKIKIKVPDLPPTDEMLAVITHWMHNSGRKSAKVYSKNCRKYLQTILTALYPTMDKKAIVLKNIQELGLFSDAINIPFPSPKRVKFTFIDLFAGTVLEEHMDFKMKHKEPCFLMLQKLFAGNSRKPFS